MRDDENRKEECVFCRIVKGELGSRRIYEDFKFLAILDINPLAEGHCLVIPKRHVQWFYDLSDDEICHLFKIAKKMSMILKEELKPDVVCMIIRGLRVPHTHIILIPSSKGDVVSKMFALLDTAQNFPPSTRENMAENLANLASHVTLFSNEELKTKLNATEKRLRRYFFNLKI